MKKTYKKDRKDKKVSKKRKYNKTRTKKKINRKKIPLMIALLNAITKNKKLKIKY